MSLHAKCPHCKHEAVLVAEAAGKTIRCKGCSKPFLVKPMARNGSDGEMKAAVRAGAPSAAHAKPRLHDDEDDDDRPVRGSKHESDPALWVGLASIGGVTLLASLLVAFLIVNRHPAVAQIAPPVPPPLVAKAIVEPQPAPKPPKVEVPKPEAIVRNDPPKNNPVVEPTPPAPPPKVAGVPANLYGTQGNLPVEPAIPAPHTYMRARADDSFYRLSNPQIRPQGGNPRGTFAIQFQITHRGSSYPTHVLMRYADGRTETVGLGPVIEREGGTLSFFKDPTGRFQYPDDVECFLVRIESSFGPPVGQFMLSDVAVLGDVGTPSRPREWTPEEIARFTKEAPAGLRENGSPGVGVDTEFAGQSNGGVPRRYADPKNPLLGLEWRGGSWQGEKCLGGLRPVYSQDQPKLLGQSVVAREGYAVSGVEVQYRNNVDALKLHFRKLRADGSLDASDSYESEWFGQPDPACQRKTFGNTGRRVLGVFTRSGAVVDGMALVMEGP